MVSLWLICVCVVVSSARLSDVEKYEVIRPQRRQERQRRSLQDDQVYPDTVRYELFIEGRNHTIHLEKNRNLIGRDYTETRYTEDGKRVTTSPKEDHCFYQGHIEGMADSSASVGICSGISGFVRARQQVYVIEPLGATEDEDHAVYRREHLRFNTTVVYDRDRDQDQDRGPRLAGFSTSWKTKPKGPQKFVEMYVVVDNNEYQQYGEETTSRIFAVINHVDKLYRPLNIRVMLVGLEIWSIRDYIVVHERSETTLDNFMLWRQKDLLPRMKHDNAQFVTGIDFEGDTVGLANKFAMCTENSGGVNQDHHDNLIGLASTIAHEMGHNLGVSHDTVGCVCGPAQSRRRNCVMAGQLSVSNQDFPEFFSGCSMNQLAEYLERAQPTCLHRPDSVNTLSASRRCGNALLDPDEECDCGTVEECNNLCCDASTCLLTKGSRCAHGECCHECQIQKSGVLCRTSASDCDLPEYCSGTSGECPEDSFQMNGKRCYDQGAGFCYNGRCPTRNQHCWRLFGEGARESPDLCFSQNARGLEGANCGKTKLGFTPCAPADVKCGSIFCDGGDRSITGRHATYNLFRWQCKMAVDDDKTRNIDMVPNGTHCGWDKVCLNYKCVNVSVYGQRGDCAKKCNNNGVCNHKNECQCHPGWAPPLCSIQYTDLLQGQSALIAGMCSTLGILIVVTTAIVGLVYCRKGNMDIYVSKRKVHSAQKMFHEASVKDRLQVGHPTLIASSATLIGAPLIVVAARGRSAQQSPQSRSSESAGSGTEPAKPVPPTKPLPPFNKPQYQAATPSPSTAPRVKLNPPVPPVKPRPPQAARTKASLPPLPPAKPQLQTHMKSSSRVSSSTKAEDDHAEREIL